jgi:hypothetical protein
MTEAVKDEKLSDENYALMQAQFELMGGLLVKLPPIGKFIERIERAETVGPIVDPTLYRDAMGNLENIKRLARAFLGVQQEVARQIAESERGKPR